MSSLQPLDSKLTRYLKKLLRELTHSGSKTLCPKDFKAALQYLEKGEDYIDFAFKELKRYLKKEHAEVRYSTVQLYNEFFMRFESFRENVLERLDKFFTYALGIKSTLPKPDKAAADLVTLSIGIFDKWHSRYGSDHAILRKGYNHLKDIHNLDFASRAFVDPKEKKEKEESQMRLLKINRERLKNSTKQMEELRPEIEASLTSLESCFELLLPSDDLFKGPENDKSANSKPDMRLFGVINSRDVNIEIHLDEKVKIVEDDENGPILEAAKDSFKLISNSFHPKVVAWTELIRIAQGGSELLNTARHLKTRLDSAIAKYNSMSIVKPQDCNDEGDEVSSDSDLEEVRPIKIDKRTVTREEIGFLSERLDLYQTKQSKVGESSKTVASSSSDDIPSEPSQASQDTLNKRKADLLKIAPKLPYDIDLYHWEDEKLTTPTMLPSVYNVTCEGSRFWKGSISGEIDELAVPGGSDSLRCRVIEFAGSFEPVTRSCRAPLPSGKLCPRHDRNKCPLHGVIVPRDAEGNIVNPEDKEKVKESKKGPVVPDWQDPKLLAEIKAATGLDLKMPVKGQRMKNKKHPGLTDLNPKIDTPESRIGKKIFNKKSMKRVAATLDKLDHKRFRDKYGDQFNYVHDTS